MTGTMTSAEATKASGRGSALEVLLILRLSLSRFGGPIAHVVLISACGGIALALRQA